MSQLGWSLGRMTSSAYNNPGKQLPNVSLSDQATTELKGYKGNDFVTDVR